MHQNNIIHCDIKVMDTHCSTLTHWLALQPQNIMCTDDPDNFDIKVTDFGLSKVNECNALIGLQLHV